MYNKLSDKKIFYGERWIYSAGFNISVKPNNKERLIEEIDDLNKLLSAGASVSILSHQGSYDDNTAVELDYLIPYLNNYLNTKIKYYPENNTNSAIHFSKNIKPGEAVIFGNTRFHKGEQINDLKTQLKAEKDLNKQFEDIINNKDQEIENRNFYLLLSMPQLVCCVGM